MAALCDMRFLAFLPSPHPPIQQPMQQSSSTCQAWGLAAVDTRSPAGTTALMCAAAVGHEEMVKELCFLLSNDARVHSHAYICACKHACPRVLARRLVREGLILCFRYHKHTK